jgi:L-alanine-DL-glutamate epimerase-like enolase superfamily enzyme
MIPQIKPLHNSDRLHVKITRITAMQVNKETWIRIDTDAGLSGYGPSAESGPVTRDILASLETGRHAALSLIGQDPLAIQVHFHNLFYRRAAAWASCACLQWY